MSRFKRNKQVRFLPLLLSLQLFIPTSLFAQEDAGSKTYQHWKSSAQVLNMMGGLSQQMLQQHQQRMQQQQAQQMMMSLQRDLSLQPVDPTQVPPIISQNGCMVLPAKGNRVSGGISCDAPFDEQALQTGVYDSLLEISQNNINTVSNFLTEGHERFTTQGMGCYDKAKKQLQQKLESRLELLSQMEESINRRGEQFQKLAKNDLMEIQKGSALLDGNVADKTVQSALKNYRFEDQFKDPACRSYFSGQQFKTLGKKGLRGIESELTNEVAKLNPQGFLAKSSQLEKEIKNFGKHVNNKQSNSDGLQPYSEDPFAGFDNQLLSRNSKAIQKIMSNTFDEVLEDNKKVMRKMESIIPSDDPVASKMFQEVQQGVQSGTIDLGFRLSEFEKETKNSCLNNYIKNNFGSADGFTRKLQDPNVSKKANEEADSSFKNYIVEILEDERLTIETKKKKIAQAQSDPANSRYGMVTGKSITVEGKNISASTRLPANAMVDMFVDNCVARFDGEPNSKGSTYRDITNAMKSYKNEFTQMKTKLSSRLQSNIVNELLRCPSDENTGSAAMSCDGNSLKTESNNFCLRTANKCAANINGCMEKAQKLVETTRQKQMKHVDTYKQNMNGFKEDLMKEFSVIGASFEQSARELDGLFQMGTMYNMPVGLDLATKEGENTLLKGVDPALEIEDPEVYLKKVKGNIAKLKTNIKKQNDEVLKGYDAEIKKYQENYKNELNQWETLANNCKDRIKDYNKFVEQQNQAEQQRVADQKNAQGEACKKFTDFRSSPCPSSGAANGLAGDIAAIQMQLSSDSKDTISDVIASCEGFDSPSIGSNSENRNSMKYKVSLENFCDPDSSVPGGGAGAESINCQVYHKTKNKYSDYMINGVDPDGSAGVNLCTSLTKDKIKKGDDILCKTVGKQNGNVEYEWGPENLCVGNDDFTKKIVSSYAAEQSQAKDMIKVETKCSTDSSVVADNSIQSRHESAKDGALEELEVYRRNAATSEVGQIQVAACDGMDGGSVDMTGDPIQQMMRGLAGGAQGGAGGFTQ